MSLDPPFVPEFAEASFLLDIPDDRRRSSPTASWSRPSPAPPGRTNWSAPPSGPTRSCCGSGAPSLSRRARPRIGTGHLGAGHRRRRADGHDRGRPGEPVRGLHGVDQRADRRHRYLRAAQPGGGRRGSRTGPDRAGRRGGRSRHRRPRRRRARGPAVSTAMEEEARALFQGDAGGFMVNWPYVWQAANGGWTGSFDLSFIDDLGWTIYPQTVEGEESAPAPRRDHARNRCVHRVPRRGPRGGGPASPRRRAGPSTCSSPATRASEESYDDPEVVEAFPMAEVILESLQNAKSRPQTPFYSEVSGEPAAHLPSRRRTCSPTALRTRRPS